MIVDHDICGMQGGLHVECKAASMWSAAFVFDNLFAATPHFITCQVLADIGDGQSMQQSLSTFSAHIVRIQRILQAATPRSLVLLDEVGSGTDPVEGAVLATAILRRLAATTALTYATTHHGLVKDVADAEPGFVNASVEFDAQSLQPTYRLLWGVAGNSNALLVADGLGFDHRVVADARQLVTEVCLHCVVVVCGGGRTPHTGYQYVTHATTIKPQGLLARSTQAQAGQLLGAVGAQLKSAKEAATAAKAQRAALLASCQALEEEVARWKEDSENQSKGNGLDVQPQLDAILAQAQRGMCGCQVKSNLVVVVALA